MMIIRMFDENRDLDDYLNLFMISFGKPMSKDYFEWKYIKNPFRLNIHPVIVAEEDDKLIGIRGIVFHKMMAKGEMIYATQGAETTSHPDFRRRGIHHKMQRFAHELYRESEYRIFYSFPNETAFRNDIRMGRRPIYKRISHWKVLKTREAFHKVFQNHVLQKAGGLLSPLLWHKTTVPELRNQDVTVKLVNDVGILAAIYNTWKKPDKIYTVRDEKYLNWRFKSHPEIAYQFLAAYIGQEVKGYFVISTSESMGMKRGTIVDYIVINDDPNIFKTLLNYSLNLFKANDCVLVKTWVFTQKWAKQVVEDYGFISSRNILLRPWFVNNYLVANPTNEHNFPYDIASIEWYITPSDADIH